MRIFLTGKPGIGKTTLIKAIIDQYGSLCDGFYSEEIKVGRSRVGFSLKIINSKNCVPLAMSDGSVKIGPKVGKYTVNVKEMENILPEAFPPTPAKIRIIDEIGKMELLSQKVTRLITDQIDNCEAILICTIPLNSTHRLVKGNGR